MPLAIGASKNFGCRKLDVFLSLQKNPRNLKNTPHLKNIETFQSIESNKRKETIAKWDISRSRSKSCLNRSSRPTPRRPQFYRVNHLPYNKDANWPLVVGHMVGLRHVWMDLLLPEYQSNTWPLLGSQ